MIVLNGKKFARTNREFMDSLFSPTGTCAGFYTVYPRAIIIMDMHRNRVGCINWDGVLCSATKQVNGRYWYNYRTPELIGEYPSYSAEREEVKGIVRALIKERCSTR